MRIAAFLLCLSLMAFAAGAAAQTVDYDDDNDNLIDVRNQAQLSAIRHDLTGAGSSTATSYTDAFSNAMTNMGCRTTCAGYELRNDITLSGNWTRIGNTGFGELTPSASARYKSTFDGNGYVIRGLRFSSPEVDHLGLFTALDTGGKIRNVGLIGVNISARDSRFVGALVGYNFGHVAASYVIGAGGGQPDGR